MADYRGYEMAIREYEARLDAVRSRVSDLEREKNILIEALRPFANACQRYSHEQPEVDNLCAHDWNAAICALSAVGAL